MNCGAAQRGAAALPGTERPLRRSDSNRKIAGVCGGLGEYFRVDPTAVRLLGVVLSIIPGGIVGGVLVYLVAWLVMPAPPEGSADSSVSDEFLGV